MVVSYPNGARNSSTPGCTVRANSSNTRCWYCISVPKRAAWNSRSPFQIEIFGVIRIDGAKRRRRQQPLVQECNVAGLERVENQRLLGLLNQPVVLGVEDGMHGREADILVGAAVAGDVVRVEQLIVIGEVISDPVVGCALPAMLSASGAR